MSALSIFHGQATLSPGVIKIGETYKKHCKFNKYGDQVEKGLINSFKIIDGRGAMGHLEKKRRAFIYHSSTIPIIQLQLQNKQIVGIIYT